MVTGEERPAVVLFDGDCGLCSRGVLFIFRRDPRGRFRFASLQSRVGRRLLRERGLPEDRRDTLVLLDEAGAHVRSDAALRIARGLSPPWRWAWGARVLPRRLRDGAYDLVARHRRRFGPAVEACRTPSPQLRERFLDEDQPSTGGAPGAT